MTPQEKAKELIDKYLNASFNCNECPVQMCDIECTKLYIEEASECALIAVDEIIESVRECSDKDILHLHLIYWRKVKDELLKQQNNG